MTEGRVLGCYNNNVRDACHELSRNLLAARFGSTGTILLWTLKVVGFAGKYEAPYLWKSPLRCVNDVQGLLVLI